jgi:hypothetical protein
VKIGALDVVMLVDVVHELQVADPWVAYVSDGDHERAVTTRRRVLGGLAEEGDPIVAAHLSGTERFVRSGDRFRWEFAKDEAAPVE